MLIEFNKSKTNSMNDFVRFRYLQMTTSELDPILKKGIKLLHSRSRDSCDQLKTLLDDSLRLKQERSITPGKVRTLPHTKESFLANRDSPIPRVQGNPVVLGVKHENKRELLSKPRDEEHISKKPRLDSPHIHSHSPSPTLSLMSDSSSRSRKSEESDSDADMNDLAMKIGINCSVCKSFEISSGNQLVECHDCHCLYHQECHKPPVSQNDLTDPRLVWYCAKCTRHLKKQPVVVPIVTTPPALSVRSAAAVGKNGSSKVLPTVKSSTLQRPTPFANLTTATRSLAGANSSTSSSSLSSSSSNNGKGSSAQASNRATSSSTSNSLMNAERRVHLMKKKAAAKNAERRKI